MNPECLNQNGQPVLAALPIGEFNNLKQYLENLLALRQGKALEKNCSALDIDEQL